MIKISVDVTAVRLIVDEVATLKLKMGTNNYVDFPIYDESFPLVKAGKKFRLTLEELEMNEADGPIVNLLKGNKPATEAAKEAYRAISDAWLAADSKMGKTPNIIDELRRDVAALETIKKALNQLEVRNEERLASYPDPDDAYLTAEEKEIKSHMKVLQSGILDVKKVEGMITGNAGEEEENTISYVTGLIKKQAEQVSEYQIKQDTISGEEGKDFVVFRELTTPVNDGALPNKENEEATPMIYPCDMCIHVKVGYPKEGVCSGCKNFDKLDPSGAESAAEVREKYIRYDKAPDELIPMSDEEVSEFIKTRSEYPEELAQECQGSFDEVSEGIPMGVLRFAANEVKKITKAWADKDEDKERTKRFKCPVCVHKPYSETCALCKEGSMFKPSKGPFCDGCKHIGVNQESGPCAVCFEGMMYESDKEVTMENTAVVNPDEEFKVPEYLIHQRVEIPAERILHKDEKPLPPKRRAKTNNATCKRCANISRIPECQECVDFGNFKAY